MSLNEVEAGLKKWVHVDYEEHSGHAAKDVMRSSFSEMEHFDPYTNSKNKNYLLNNNHPYSNHHFIVSRNSTVLFS